MKMMAIKATVYGLIGTFLGFVGAGCMDASTSLEINHVKMVGVATLFLVLALIEIINMKKIADEET